jgi:hypothetical protein
MRYSIIILQNRHVNGDYRGPWSDTLYYNVLSGWGRGEATATRFLRRRPGKDAIIKGYDAGCRAQDIARLAGMHEELVARGVTNCNRIVFRHISTSRKEKDAVHS